MQRESLHIQKVPWLLSKPIKNLLFLQSRVSTHHRSNSSFSSLKSLSSSKHAGRKMWWTMTTFGNSLARAQDSADARCKPPRQYRVTVQEQRNPSSSAGPWITAADRVTLPVDRLEKIPRACVSSTHWILKPLSLKWKDNRIIFINKKEKNPTQ